MQYIFLDKEIRKLKKECGVNKGDLWQMLELVTHLTLNGEIAINTAERYAAELFKAAERAAES